ncbi:ABC transporter I family member 6, chloroplastic isoform X2 [Magnolia sinica]|uniref:ABC transporter I family member 6, chloroplastic isoform X2 n=1 Tax=Magnolia sinica TaxID=86752 RepID=UPI00265A4AA8|nr:ABC transporter I family member 6, chloroplastic isoform X2 [Magnolia sinica]
MALFLHFPLSFSSSSSRNRTPNSPIFITPATNSFPLPTFRRSLRHRHRPLTPNASVAVDSLATNSCTDPRGDSPKLLLEVKDLTAVIAESKQQILRGINLSIFEGEVHAIMGKNGSGKSTFSKFYGFLSPKLAAVNMNPNFLDRNVNEGFSGGEKKRNEILQLAVLEADLAILDEIDSGLDVDALQDVAKAVNSLLTPKNSVLMITHYQRLLDFINPTYVHIMEDGRIVKTGDISLAKQLEKEGYKAISAP